ncbi:uncharacterized protein BJ171DRAFT_486012 [Polychytrium aggregatum]|uniref:uncharacterized protein n=1 Tax=Polychytrium aggregatum TaxID=110093 RepID=UPI0022FE9215|nr:uncharacterized protein BJ171DRAFT_486012 [Polychytrium aggregatum]KAI9209279.1 hypothetical protein BJ171DRAFT_486012 [Polychytrium aggregatum]
MVLSAKSILQVLLLAGILLSWATFDYISKALMRGKNTLRMSFGSEKMPKSVHVGEVFNVTLEYTATVGTTSSYINTTVHMALRCAGNKDGGITFHSEPFIINTKHGVLFFEYPITEADLRPDLGSALCYMSMSFDYASTDQSLDSRTPRIYSFDHMSSLFKVSRAERKFKIPKKAKKVVTLGAKTASTSSTASAASTVSVASPASAKAPQIVTTVISEVVHESVEVQIPEIDEALRLWLRKIPSGYATDPKTPVVLKVSEFAVEHPDNWVLDTGSHLSLSTVAMIIVGFYALRFLLKLSKVQRFLGKLSALFFDWLHQDIQASIAPPKRPNQRQ